MCDHKWQQFFEEAIFGGEIVKAISLWQPWASLVIDGRKKIETRSWKAPAWLIGRPVAIHATKKVDREFSEECGYDVIPCGYVLGIVTIDKTEQFTEEFYEEISRYPEGKYGDFYPGRWGWFMTVKEKFKEPYVQRGAQGIFTWEMPCNCDLDVNHLCATHAAERAAIRSHKTPTDEELSKGTFSCPVCGLGTPHSTEAHKVSCLPETVYGIPSIQKDFLVWLGSDKQKALEMADLSREVIEYRRHHKPVE